MFKEFIIVTFSHVKTKVAKYIQNLIKIDPRVPGKKTLVENDWGF